MFVYGEPEVLSPPASPGLGAVTYSDAQVAQALRESMAQGFSLLDSIAGAIRVFGVPVDQAYRAGDIVAAEVQGKPATGAASLVATEVEQTTATTYTDAQVAQALRESVAQGFGLADSINGAIEVYGVPEAQANRAGDIVAAEMDAAARAAAAGVVVTAAATSTAQTYTDAQVAQALRESMAQGFSLLDSIAGAIRVFGVPVDQAYRAGDIVAAEAQRATAAKAAADAAAKAAADAAAEAARKAAADAAAKAAADAAAKAARDAAAKAAADAAAKAALTVKPAVAKTFTDAEIAQAMRESLKQGFTLKDAVTGAVTKFAVPRDQAIRVAEQIAAETQPTTTTPAQAGIGPLLLAVAAAYVLGA